MTHKKVMKTFNFSMTFLNVATWFVFDNDNLIVYNIIIKKHNNTNKHNDNDDIYFWMIQYFFNHSHLKTITLK